MVRRVCEQYGLPDPLLTLQTPPTKASWKSLTKARVVDWWLVRYRGEALTLDSLIHFKPQYYSLTRPHRILSSASSPYEVSRANTVCRMLSGRYITDTGLGTGHRITLMVTADYVGDQGVEGKRQLVT